MSDVARKVFPMDTVLALILGKEDVDVKELAGYLAGRSLTCCCAARTVGPMAAGWLASLYPKFIQLEWDGETPWDGFVIDTKKAIGDSVSIPPMGPALQALVGKTLDAFAEMDATNKAQNAAIVALQNTVETLTPFENKAQELEKKCEQLEAKIKTMTTDMGALRKELMPYQGKMAVDQQELVSMIKDTIKDNLKGFVAGAAVGAVAGEAVAAAAEEEKPADNGPAEEFGFGTSGSDSDGFGF